MGGILTVSGWVTDLVRVSGRYHIIPGFGPEKQCIGRWRNGKEMEEFGNTFPDFCDTSAGTC